jgi:pilus assembly protein Flp/PilA
VGHARVLKACSQLNKIFALAPPTNGRHAWPAKSGRYPQSYGPDSPNFRFSTAGSRGGTLRTAHHVTANQTGWRIKLKQKVQKFLSDESGATAIEYGLIAAGIALAIIAVVNGLGTNLNAQFTAINGSLK